MLNSGGYLGHRITGWLSEEQAEDGLGELLGECLMISPAVKPPGTLRVTERSRVGEMLRAVECDSNSG
jgi:hypothetical protein